MRYDYAQKILFVILFFTPDNLGKRIGRSNAARKKKYLDAKTQKENLKQAYIGAEFGMFEVQACRPLLANSIKGAVL